MDTKLNDNELTGRIKGEKRLFWLLTVILAPLMSIAIVGGLGLAIWVFQLWVGPPGPPSSMG